jgi:hypothetical protein
MSYRFPDSFRGGSGYFILILLASSQHNLYDIYLLLCIQYYAPDDGKKTCPKNVEFYSKNKFEKLMHLIGFIIRMYTIITQLPYEIFSLAFSLITYCC